MGTTKKKMFDWTVNLGHLFIVFSLFLSAAGLYANDSSRLATLESKMTSMEGQNLPPRVSAIEAQIDYVRSDLRDIKETLNQIRDSMRPQPSQRR